MSLMSFIQGKTVRGLREYSPSQAVEQSSQGILGKNGFYRALEEAMIGKEVGHRSIRGDWKGIRVRVGWGEGCKGNVAKGLGLEVDGPWDSATRRNGEQLPAPESRTKAWGEGPNVGRRDTFKSLCSAEYQQYAEENILSCFSRTDSRRLSIPLFM